MDCRHHAGPRQQAGCMYNMYNSPVVGGGGYSGTLTHIQGYIPLQYIQEPKSWRWSETWGAKDPKCTALEFLLCVSVWSRCFEPIHLQYETGLWPVGIKFTMLLRQNWKLIDDLNLSSSQETVVSLLFNLCLLLLIDILLGTGILLWIEITFVPCFTPFFGWMDWICVWCVSPVRKGMYRVQMLFYFILHHRIFLSQVIFR